MPKFRSAIEHLRAHGPKSTILYAYRRGLESARWYVDSGFDRKHHVQTAGLIDFEHLRIDNANVKHGTWYEAMPAPVFRQIVAQMGIRYEEYVFVDYGSGKGRALLLAAEFPFRRAVGVEFSPELHEAALANFQ